MILSPGLAREQGTDVCFRPIPATSHINKRESLAGVVGARHCFPVRGKSVFEQAFANLGRIPRDAWLVALFACGLSASSDLAFWTTGGKLSWAWIAPFLVLAAIWLAGVYVSALGIVERQTSFRGYARFALTSIATAVPLGLTLALAILGTPYLTEGARVSGLLVGLVLTFVLASLLAGWPVAQSVSAEFVSPFRVLKATRGHRGSLIFVGFAAAALGRSDLVPDIAKANNVGEAALIAIADGFIGLLFLGLTAAIATAAWQFAARQDDALDPS